MVFKEGIYIFSEKNMYRFFIVSVYLHHHLELSLHYLAFVYHKLIQFCSESTIASEKIAISPFSF